MNCSRSFADFMQEALYNSEHGYYASGRVHIGKQGDFFTNVSVGKIYGHILTYVFQEVWEQLGKPQEFFIVEQGAHDGRLAHDILETLQEVQSERRDFAASIRYYIVEPLSFHRKHQQKTLKNFTNIAWVSTIQELPPFEGVHFSNELLDAFPVHILTWDGSMWLEKRVATNDGQHFSWITTPIENRVLSKLAYTDEVQGAHGAQNLSVQTSSMVQDRIFHTHRDEAQCEADEVRRTKDFDAGLYVSYCPSQNSSPTQHSSSLPQAAVDGDEISDLTPEQRTNSLAEVEFRENSNEQLHKVALSLPTHLPIGFQWEVRLGVQPWLAEIAERMKRGAILIADYGYAGDDRFAPYRKEGSIACYQGHHRYENPLEKPGERDISAHVDFTDLTTKALETGWEVLGYNDQHHFLIGASEQWLRSFEGKVLDANTQKNLRYLRTLLHPETMGCQFKFLGLGRNISLEQPLSAFRYGNHHYSANRPNSSLRV